MTFGDGFILSVIALSVLFAWLRGISRELATLLAIGVGVLAIFLFGDTFSGLFGTGAMKAIAALALLFLIAFAAASIGFEVLASTFLGREPGTIDKIAGAVFGILRGWLIVGLAYLALTYYFPENDMPEPIENAKLAGIAKSAASVLESIGLEREYDEAESSDSIGASE